MSHQDAKEMFIEGIRFDLMQRSPVVILRNAESNRFLPIWIGMNEAAAIQLVLENTTTPRPMSHDLMVGILRGVGHKVKEIYIHSIVEKVFHANILLEGADGKHIEVDSRPSDALAVAVRTQAAIFVSDTVLGESALDKVTVGSPIEVESEREEFKSFLENLKPSDFME